MFVLLAKIVGCCGISCKNCHTWCQNCNNACLRRYFGNAHKKARRFANNQHLSQPLYHTAMQISRWFAKFPHPICATVLHREHPTPSPTLKNPAKTAPLPSKTQFQPNKSRPLPDKARHLPSKTQTCPNCHTQLLQSLTPSLPPLCRTAVGRA